MFIKLYNSWYDNKTETAKDINELILTFSKEGNINLDACQCEEFKTFSSDDWNSFEESKKKIKFYLITDLHFFLRLMLTGVLS